MDATREMIEGVNAQSQPAWNAKVAKQEAEARAKTKAERRLRVREKRLKEMEENICGGVLVISFYVVMVLATL